MSEKMTQPEVKLGRGTPEMYDEYMDFINLVFGFNGDDRDFYKLLPKLYKTKYAPCEHNHIITENGKIKAAVGVYPSTVDVGGIELTCHGIGNVAVHPYSRSKGYMKQAMNAAVAGMIEDGADYSNLGGRRQRYGYFSFETVGETFHFHIDSSNVRHFYANKTVRAVNVKPVYTEDYEDLFEIYTLLYNQPFYCIRDMESLYDIMTSWRAGIFVFRDEQERFLGYLICNGNTVSELLLTDNAYFYDVIKAFFGYTGKGDITLEFPAFQKELSDLAFALCEEVTVHANENYSVFNYKKVIFAFMNLKLTYIDLPDGRLSILIHGVAGDEQLLIGVKDGQIVVTETEEEPDIELSHMEAMSFLFGLYSPLRNKIGTAERAWFPLPIYSYSADNV